MGMLEKMNTVTKIKDKWDKFILCSHYCLIKDTHLNLCHESTPERKTLKCHSSIYCVTNHTRLKVTIHFRLSSRHITELQDQI